MCPLEDVTLVHVDQYWEVQPILMDVFDLLVDSTMPSLHKEECQIARLKMKNKMDHCFILYLFLTVIFIYYIRYYKINVFLNQPHDTKLACNRDLMAISKSIFTFP